MAEYRITYSIECADSPDAEFAEIGFGSSPAEATVAAALEFIAADVQNQNWETTTGMPDPWAVDNEDEYPDA